MTRISQSHLGVAHFSFRDPVVAAFIVLPVFVAVMLVWGVASAWRRGGATAGDAVRAGGGVAGGGRGGLRLALAWNVMGLGLLINVVVVAILATPTLARFGDRQLNTW